MNDKTTDLDGIHHAWVAGYDTGFAAGQMAASIDLARQWALQQAAADLEQAAQLADSRHGPGWAETVTRLPVERNTRLRRLEDEGRGA